MPFSRSLLQRESSLLRVSGEERHLLGNSIPKANYHPDGAPAPISDDLRRRSERLLDSLLNDAHAK